MDLGKRIKAIRSSKAWTQEHLSHVSDVSVRTISRLENGKTGPQNEILMALSNAFGMTVEELITSSSVLNENISEVVKMKIEFGFSLQKFRHEFNLYVSTLDSMNRKIRENLEIPQGKKEAVERLRKSYAECLEDIRKHDFFLRRHMSDEGLTQYINKYDSFFNCHTARIGLAWSLSVAEYESKVSANNSAFFSL